MRTVLMLSLVLMPAAATGQNAGMTQQEDDAFVKQFGPLPAIPDDVKAAALTTDSERGAIDAVRKLLKDPDSAKFRGIKRGGSFDYCGWVNAKNSYGGYAGYSVFFATKKGTSILPPDLSEPALCQ